jgi:hypothetical protein
MLPDYPKVKDELRQFFSKWMREGMQRRLGHFSEIPRHQVFEGTAMSTVHSSGQEDLTPFKPYEVELQTTYEEVPKLTLPQILSRLDRMAQDMADPLARSVYKTVSDAADKVGTVVKPAQRFTPQVIFEVLEKIEVPFDKEGNPELPSFHIHPDDVETLKESLQSLQNDPQLRSRYHEILQRKKDQWRVREAHRRLVG